MIECVHFVNEYIIIKNSLICKGVKNTIIDNYVYIIYKTFLLKWIIILFMK